MLARREEALTRQLNAAVDRYAEALELFDAWTKHSVKDHAELDAALDGLSEPQQVSSRWRSCGAR